MKYPDFRIRWGMVIDLDKCTGCGACMVACQSENNVAPQEDGTDKLRTNTWMLVYKLQNGGHGAGYDVAYLPRPCMQCGTPSCVTVCPMIATDKNEEGGIVSQIFPRCFGCRYCMAACPYHVRYFNWFDPLFPKGMEKTLTPFTSTRPRGVVEKCHFCHHRFQAAKELARYEGRDPDNLPEDAWTPACVEMCPTGAMHFGDVNNPAHKVYKMSKSPHAARLLARLGTDPQVYYYSKRPWVLAQLDNYEHGGGPLDPDYGGHGETKDVKHGGGSHG